MAARDIWIFAYGSLIWDPRFPWVERHRARLHGYHRGMCIYSHVWRGSPERPGLVLGLDRGGSCRGVAYRVAGAEAAAVVAALEARERVTAVYLGRHVPIVLESALERGRKRAAPAPEASPAGPRRVTALTYIADRGHHQYAGRLEPEDAARLIRQGRGQGGHNIEYLDATVRHLEDLGIPDAPLAGLARVVRERS